MGTEIIIPKSKKEIAEGRELNYEYTEQIGDQPLLRPYFETQHFDVDIDKMLQGYEAPDGVYLVAYVDGVAAGTVAVRRLDGTTCEMKRLYVRPHFRELASVDDLQKRQSRKQKCSATPE